MILMIHPCGRSQYHSRSLNSMFRRCSRISFKYRNRCFASHKLYGNDFATPKSLHSNEIPLLKSFRRIDQQPVRCCFSSSTSITSITKERNKSIKFKEDGADVKSIEEQYSKKTPLEHVLLRPGMYVGPCESISHDCWVLDPPGLSPPSQSLGQDEKGIIPFAIIQKECRYIRTYNIYIYIICSTVQHVNMHTDFFYSIIIICTKNAIHCITNNYCAALI